MPRSALDIHSVEHLVFEILLAYGARKKQKPVGQRALAVVNMRHNTKISNVLYIHLFQKVYIPIL